MCNFFFIGRDARRGDQRTLAASLPVIKSKAHSLTISPYLCCALLLIYLIFPYISIDSPSLRPATALLIICNPITTVQKNLPLRRRHCPKQAEQVFFLFDRRQCSIFFRICRRTDNIIRRHLKIVCHIPYHMYIRRAPAVNIVSKAFRSNKQIIGDLLTAFRMSFYKRSNSFCHCHFITFRY